MKYFTRALLFIFSVAAIASCKKNTPQPPLNVQTTILPGTFSTELSAICFTDNSVGYVADYVGNIYKTTDAGQSWTTQATGETTTIYGLYFINANTGYASGGQTSCNGAGCVPPGGYVLQTTDGGQHWNRIYTISKFALYDICFTDANNGYAIALNDVYKTTDAGKSWSLTNIKIPNTNNAPTGALLLHMGFANMQNGYIMGNTGYLHTTTNSGATWQSINLFNDTAYRGFAAVPGYVYISGARIIKQNGNGVWQQLTNSPSGINGLHFIDANTGIAVGGGTSAGDFTGYTRAAIYSTHDGGQTWSGGDDTKNYPAPTAISFPTPNTGYAIASRQVVKIEIK